ncbi:MAG: 50S ribosomal protein L19 [Candidatus Competibacteraceae bacterium]
MSKLVEEFEKEQMTREIPVFNPGDTVVVRVKVKEGNRERLQSLRGHRDRQRFNPGAEFGLHRAQAFPARAWSACSDLQSAIADISVKRRGGVRRAKLYYLRGLEGKAARIRESFRKVRRHGGGWGDRFGSPLFVSTPLSPQGERR